MKLKDLETYKLSMDIGDKVYSIAMEMDYFNKDKLSKQWVRATGSISLNISECFGRYSYKDQRTSYYYSRGSLNEIVTCLQKARKRELISDDEYNLLLNDHNTLGIKLNNFINSVNKLINQ